MTRSGRFAERYPGFGVFVVGLGTLVVPFDSSVNVAFPHIIRGFDLAIPAIQWVVIAYTLTYAALTLVFGRVSDMLGYRRIFQMGNVSGAVAFLLCAAAPTYGWLLGARVLQGVGAALALSCGPALATSLYPEAKRARVLGIYTMMFGIGSALGTILAGELVQYFGWRSVFWFRAPIALLAFSLTWTFPRDTPRGQQRFDAPGAALLVLAITGLLLTLNQLRVARPVAVGLHWRRSHHDVVRHRVHPPRDQHRASDHRSEVFSGSRFRAGHRSARDVLNLAGFSVMLLVPFYLDRLGGLSVPMSGLALASSPLGIMLAGPLAGFMARQIVSRRLALIGATAMALAQISIGMADAPANIPVLVASMFLQGLGLGLFQVACFDISTATIPREARGVAGSLVMMTRTVGVVTAATVLMLIFQTMRALSERQGVPDGAAFLVGFHAAFRVAATLAVLVVVAGWWRGWGRRNSCR